MTATAKKQKPLKRHPSKLKKMSAYMILTLILISIVAVLFAFPLYWIRMGNVNLKDAFCTIKDGQMTLNGMHVSPYEKGNIFNREPRRPRRLLMHKREILRLFAKIKQDGYTLVPLSLYFKGPRVKVEIGLCKGKKLYDKREAAAKKDAKREMDRALKQRR